MPPEGALPRNKIRHTRFFSLVTTTLDNIFGTKKRNLIKLDTQESLKSTFECFLTPIDKMLERNIEC